MSDDIAVSVEGVSKSFRIYTERNQSLKIALMRRKRAAFEEFWALRDVSLEIPRGITYGLLGDNGSGKSTLLKCIARILEPNEGRITTRGSLAAMLEVGSGFHPELTGRENIYLNGSILGMSRKEIDRKLDDIVEFAGIGAFINQPVKNYSSGMYVRLGFSVSIHVEPEILLVDEILAVGDLSFQQKCKEKFAELKSQGKTVVVVSHGLGEMRTFCDRAAWLEKGRLVDEGPAVRIVDTYVEKSQNARPTDNGGTRSGSGEVQVTRVEVFDRYDMDTRRFHTGDQMRLRFHYKAERPIELPVFSCSINTVDGQFLWSHNTGDAHYLPEQIQGEGSIDVVVPALPLAEGSFVANISVRDRTLAHIYDRLERAVIFDVAPGEPREAGGVIVMGARWGNLQPPTAMMIDHSTPTADLR